METHYFDMVAGVLQGDTLAPYLFIICLDYELRTSIDLMKENGFKLAKESSRRYSQWHSAFGQVETLLHSLERAAGDTSPHVNADKTEYMCFNQRGDISTLNDSSLKLVDKFTCPGSSVSSTENNINTQLAKAWTAIDRLSVKWKSDLTDKIKRSFFK